MYQTIRRRRDDGDRAERDGEGFRSSETAGQARDGRRRAMIASGAVAAPEKAGAVGEREWREPQNETGSGYAWGGFPAGGRFWSNRQPQKRRFVPGEPPRREGFPP